MLFKYIIKILFKYNNITKLYINKKMYKCINDSGAYYIGTEPSPKGFRYCAHAEKNIN